MASLRTKTTHEQIKKLDPRSIVKRDGTIIPYNEYVKKITPEKRLQYQKPLIGTGKTLKNPKRINTKGLRPVESRWKTGNTNGGVSTEQVIGSDNRTKVSDTTQFPYSAIAFIQLTFPSGIYTCTGALIDKDSVLTAAHCLNFQEGTEESVISATVSPGLNNDIPYFGTHAMKDYGIPLGWYSTNGSSDYDYAVINLATAPGLTTGAFPTTTVTNTLGQQVNVTGYPGDKADQEGSYSQWKGLGYVKSETTRVQYYDVDTYDGQSGAPVFQSRNGVIMIIGVHSGYFSNGLNGGPKLIQSAVNFILGTAS